MQTQPCLTKAPTGRAQVFHEYGQAERSDLFSVSLSVCWGYGGHDVPVLHPAPQEF